MDVRFDISQNRLYVSGQGLAHKGRNVTLLLETKNEMAHIEQTYIDYNGEFKSNLKFDGNIEDYTLIGKQIEI